MLREAIPHCVARDGHALAAQVVGRVQVGALPVHGYSIPQLSQFWAHSDINGTFSVINVTSINATAASVAVRLSWLAPASLCRHVDVFPSECLASGLQAHAIPSLLCNMSSREHPHFHLSGSC